jgi:membrane peptidoglycan carboxypeptidase
MSQHRRKAPRSDARRQTGEGPGSTGSGSRGQGGRGQGGQSYGNGGYSQGGYGTRDYSARDSRDYGGSREYGGSRDSAREYGGGGYRDEGYGRRPEAGRTDYPGSGQLGPSTRTYSRTGAGQARPATRAEARAAAQGRGGARAAGGGGGGGGRKKFIDYPRFGRTGIRRWVPSVWQLLAITLTGFGCLFGAAAVAYAMIPIPEANPDVDHQTTILYYDDSKKTELGRLETERRTKVEIDRDIKPLTQNAVLAAENRTFYSDSGISPKGIARALYTNVRGGATQGGSTITQQLAKNMYLSHERTFKRKFSEFFIAIKLDRQREKKQILEDYLNTIYFGRGAHGIEAAAQAYYGPRVHAQDLSPGQSAVLAAMIRGPGFYDPDQGEGNLQRLQARFEYVLDGMVKMGALTPAQAANTKLPLPIHPKKQDRFAGQTGYMVEDVKRELRTLVDQHKLDPEVYDNLDTGGYRIKTTFNANAEKQAQNAVNEVIKHTKQLQKLKGVRIGLAAIQPGTGAVVATYGGANYLETAESNATKAVAQPGSTFKAFALAAAFRREEPVLLQSRFAGSSPWHIPNTGEGADGETVRNEQNRSYAKFVDLLTATKLSINTAFVDLTTQIGPDAVKQAAVDAGIPDTKDLESNANARIPLGIHAVRALDIANGYATFAADGVAATPFTVSEIQDANGVVIYRHKAKTRQAFTKDVVSNVDFALEQVITGSREFGDQPTGWRAQELDRPAAGKTGTAETADPKKQHPELLGTNTTAWFAGYTPQLSTAVAMFRDLPTQPLDKKLIFGGEFPTEIWTTFMKAALEGKEAQPFPERAELKGKVINPPPKQTFTPDPTQPPDQQPQPTFSFPPNRKPKPNPQPTFTITPLPQPSCEPPFCEPLPSPTPTRTKRPHP